MARRYWLLLVAPLLLAACQAGLPADYEYDPAADFSAYQSWAWLSDEPLIVTQTGATQVDPSINPLLEQRLRVSVARVLAAKGYRHLERREQADLLVSFSLSARDETEVETVPVTGGAMGRPAGGWYTSTNVRTYTRGTLAITFSERADGRAVWHGWTSKRMYGGQAPETRAANVDLAVDSVLAEFPSRPAAQ